VGQVDHYRVVPVHLNPLVDAGFECWRFGLEEVDSGCVGFSYKLGVIVDASREAAGLWC